MIVLSPSARLSDDGDRPGLDGAMRLSLDVKSRNHNQDSTPRVGLVQIRARHPVDSLRLYVYQSVCQCFTEIQFSLRLCPSAALHRLHSYRHWWKCSWRPRRPHSVQGLQAVMKMPSNSTAYQKVLSYQVVPRVSFLGPSDRCASGTTGMGWIPLLCGLSRHGG